MPSTTVADALVDALKTAGAPRIFLTPSAAPGRALGDAAARQGLPVVAVTADATACLMAAVTGELSDAVGAAVVSLGPEARREAASALAARAPAILVTDERTRDPDGAVKASVHVDADSAPDAIAAALVLALTEPRGPVELCLEVEVASLRAQRVSGPCRPAPVAPVPEALDAAASLLGRAARPVLVAGRGARSSEVTPWLRALAEALPAPVLVTAAAKGAMPDPHPLALGLLDGPMGVELAARSDLVVPLGVHRDEVPSGGWARPVLRVGPGAPKSEEGLDVVGDIAGILADLASRLRTRDRADWDVAELDALKRRLAPPLPAGAPLGAASVVALAREATIAGTIATVDGGALRVAALERWHAVSPLECLAPAEPTRRGFALPAAVAVALARPGRRILCFAEAAALARQTAELALAARLALPVLVVATGASSETVAAIAGALGAPPLMADGPATFRAALERALVGSGPAAIAVPDAPV